LLVTKADTLTEEGKALIEYIKSDAGQEIVTANKLISIK
jgi:ABC-type Fe3+ transport system substrate-binding protein